MLIAWFNTFTHEASTFHCRVAVSQVCLFFCFILLFSVKGQWIGPPSGLPRWELNLSTASLYDGARTVLLIHLNSHTHKRSNNPLAVRECNAHFTVMCNPLFRTHAYPKNKVRQCWRHKKTADKKRKRRKNPPLLQCRVGWGSIKLNLISFSKGRAGGLKGEQMEWLNARFERCHGSLISRVPSASHRDNSSSGNPAKNRSSWCTSPYMYIR